MAKLLPAVDERVRVSARVSREFAQALDAEQCRRAGRGQVGGNSLPELVAVAIATLAEQEPDQVFRAYRAATPAMVAGQQVHLQPRISADMAEYLDLMARHLKGRMFEKRANRRSLLITALSWLLEQPDGVGNPHVALPASSEQGN